MNETEKSDIIVEIVNYDDIDEEDIRRSGRLGNRLERPGLPAAAKLTALCSLLFGIVAGVPFIILMSWLGDDWGAGAVVIAAAVFACAHAAVSAVLFRRLGRKYGVSEWKFVPLSVLPLFAIGVVLFLAAFLIGGWSGLFLAILGVCFAGYSTVYAALLSAALGIGRMIGRSGA